MATNDDDARDQPRPPLPRRQPLKLLDVHEIAAMYGVNRRTIYRRIQRRQLRARKIGGMWYASLSDIEHDHEEGPVHDEDDEGDDEASACG